MKTKQKQKTKVSEWKTKKLSSLFTVKRGGSPRPIEQYITTNKDGLNWLKIGDIKSDSKYITSTSSKILKEGLKKTILVRPGDFILSNSMSFGRPYISKIETCIHDGWLTFQKIDRNQVDQNFLYYLLLHPNTQNIFSSVSAGSGVQNLKKETVEDIFLLFPPLPEQNRIVAVLETWDKAIEKLSKKIEIKKQIKKGLMQELLTGKKRLKGFHNKWSEKKLADFTKLIHGDGDWILSKNISEGGRYKIVQLGSIRFGKYIYKKLKTISEVDFAKVNGTLLMKGDLLINRMVDGNLNLCLFMENGEYVTSVDVCWIRENIFFDNYFLMQLMLLDSKQRELLSLSSGSGRVRISKNNLFEKFKFNLPQIDEQKTISKILITSDKEIQSLERKLKIFQEQKRYLLNNLITGTIRTPQTLSAKLTK